MQCNIDAKGKLARLISGIIVTIAGIMVVVLALLGTVAGFGWWALAVFLLAAGGFQIFEGWCGWCIMRAMGFKTPM